VTRDDSEVDPSHSDRGGAAEDGRPAVATGPAAPTIGRTVLALLVFIGTTLLAGLALTPLLAVVPPTAAMFIALLVGEAAGVAFAIEVARWPLRSILANLRLPRSGRKWLLALGVGNLLVDVALLVPVAQLGGVESDPFLEDLLRTSNIGELALAFLTIAVAVPIIEELLVRGIVMRALTYKWGAVVGVLGSAAIFALLHFSWQAPFAFVSGIVWGVALLRTGSLAVSIALHMLQNGTAFVAFQLARLAGADDATVTVATPIEISAAVVAGTLGLALVITGLRRLPRDPERLAALWALPRAPTASEPERPFGSTTSTYP